MPENKALWLNAKRAPLSVGPAPYTAPRADEIVVRVRAVAVNPMDRLQQTMGDIFTPWTSYPFVLGSDVAGEVVEVGSEVARFQVGDRVVGYAAGSDKLRNRAAEGAFQDYVVLLAHMASPIPDATPFEDAAVLPLGISTAACGLFQKDFLALNAPSASPAPAGKTLVVWGGSTSVGSNAIQLAVAAGYDVVTTASPRNFAYVKGLGAREAFDYRSKTVISDIVGALRGREIAGALAIGLGSAAACIDIVGACKGARFVAMATPPTSFDNVPAGRGRLRRLIPAIARMLAGTVALSLKARRRGVRTKMIWGSALIANEVGPMIFEAFLPAALAEARFVAAPSPTVVGAGLAQIPAALERQRLGVSAGKLVVTL
jgi:NADPH:quinone reductase-like Zn-dependent oxidoreductase